MISGGNATIYVSDMDRAVEFYSKTLGLSLAFRAGNEWADIDAGDGFKIGLHPAGDYSPKPGAQGAIHVGLGVTQPIETVVESLRAQGIEFQGPVLDQGYIKLAFFGDPDGNPLYLAESPHSG